VKTRRAFDPAADTSSDPEADLAANFDPNVPTSARAHAWNSVSVQSLSPARRRHANGDDPNEYARYGPAMDKISPEARSENMRRVRGRNTKPELAVRRILHASGYRFRLHRNDLAGRPDIFLPRFKTVVFVHGCFWHGHRGCKRATIPTSRSGFWVDKIDGNRNRDERNVRQLELSGYRVVTVWQCELRDPEAIIRRVDLATRRVSA
jgi:DNA mismatch endonuclease (patch repair protein)